MEEVKVIKDNIMDEFAKINKRVDSLVGVVAEMQKTIDELTEKRKTDGFRRLPDALLARWTMLEEIKPPLSEEFKQKLYSGMLEEIKPPLSDEFKQRLYSDITYNFAKHEFQENPPVGGNPPVTPQPVATIIEEGTRNERVTKMQKIIDGGLSDAFIARWNMINLPKEIREEDNSKDITGSFDKYQPLNGYDRFDKDDAKNGPFQEKPPAVGKFRLI